MSWGGFVSVNGGLYSLPATAALAGTTVVVEIERTQIGIWQGQNAVATLPRQTRGIAIHPTEWAAAEVRAGAPPLT